MVNSNIFLSRILFTILLFNIALTSRSAAWQEIQMFDFPVNTIKGKFKLGDDSQPWRTLSNTSPIDDKGDFTLTVGVTPSSSTSYSITVPHFKNKANKWEIKGTKIIEVSAEGTDEKAVFDLNKHCVTITTSGYIATQSADAKNYRQFEEVFKKLLKTLQSKPNYISEADQYTVPEKLYPVYAATRILGMILPFDADKQLCIEVVKRIGWKYTSVNQKSELMGEPFCVNYIALDEGPDVLANKADWIVYFNDDGTLPIQQTVSFHQPKNDIGETNIMIISDTILELMEKEGFEFEVTKNSDVTQTLASVKNGNTYELSCYETDNNYNFKIVSYFNWDFIK